MKTHKLISLILAVMTLLSVVTVTPSVGAVKRYKKNGIVYTLDKKGNATVVRLKFTFEQSINKPAIPSQIDGHTVTRLDFEENKNGKITFDIPEKLYIPKTVKYISKNFINYIWSYETYSVSKPCYRYVCDRGSYAQKFALKHKLVYIIKGEKKASGSIRYFLNGYFGGELLNQKGKSVKSSDLISIKYNGTTNIKPTFVLKIHNIKLKRNKDYKISGYYNNFAVGTGFIKIEGIGDYADSDYICFDIIPPTAGIDKLRKNKNNKVQVYTFLESVDTELDFYPQEIQFSEYKNFKEKQSVVLTDCKDYLFDYDKDKDTYFYYTIIDQLTKGKKYYFRVRNFLKTSSLYLSSKDTLLHYGYNDIYGKWSKVKSITI